VIDQPFRFRLERVHSLRRQSERSAQESLAVSLGERRAGESALRRIDTTIAGAQAAARRVAGPGAGPVSGAELLAAELYMERLSGRRAAATRELTARDAAVEERRRDLLAAARERQALDRLRDRRHKEHRHEAARVEGERLDEMALAVHRRREQAR
jgi:flagellar FliJ protein